MAVIREYGYLSVAGVDDGLDHVVIPQSAFSWLKQRALERTVEEKELFRLTSRFGQECLQVCNYVGLLQTPDGCRIEILPKTTTRHESAEQAREILWRMLTEVYRLKSAVHEQASLNTLDHDWLELLIRMVLDEINQVVHRGIRSDYVRIESCAPFLKGQLQVSKQIRLRPGQQAQFCISHDRYLPDRPENRLIRLALAVLNRWTQVPANQRLCQELLFIFHEIPESTNPRVDLSRWSDGRDMAHYQSLLPWIKLILAERAPVFAAGQWQGISLLFPMERLFEEYVAILLSRQLTAGYKLQPQAHAEYLVTHRAQKWFQLQPDLLILNGKERVTVLDTKWKLLDSNLVTTNDKYQLKQSDLYQLFAYGEKYLEGKGELFLIYPMHEQFGKSLPVFEYKPGLRLWVVPFDLTRGELLAGDWTVSADWYKQVLARVA